jgi:GT2 family glycosyltransferase
VTLSIAIPSYNRGQTLCDTLERLLPLRPPVSEIVVVDQTAAHPPAVRARLEQWEQHGDVRLIRLPEPSIPHAMNTALVAARHPYVLFLDDDVIPSATLFAEHVTALREPGVAAVVGQVLQPGEEPQHFAEDVLRGGVLRDLEFRFNHDTPCDVQNVIACNLSVSRERALAAGGFDENFIAVAYRFETDFALRIVAGGGRVRFHPAASVRHLKIPTGGVRAWGDHRRSASPMHSVGDYYFGWHHAPHFWAYVLRRLVKNVATRYLAAHPWHIPAKLAGEGRGLLLARRLRRKGRRLRVVEEAG